MKPLKMKNIGRELGVLIALLVMILIFTLIDRAYFTAGNMVDIVKQATINGILAIGITFAIISGGIDLSIGCTFAIVIVAVGQFTVMGFVPAAAILFGAVVGAVLGSINGILITKMHLQPFIATLGTMSIYRGFAYVVTGGWPVLGIPDSYRRALGAKIIGDIPVSILVLAAIALITHILLQKTRFGNYLFAVGGNEEAAKLSGVNVDLTKIIAYLICGVCAAFAGMIMLANLGTGEPASGQGYELDAIAASAIGGTRMAGGRGSIVGTLLGALLLAALKIGLIITGVSTFWQFIVTGIIIIIAAYFEIIQAKISVMMSRKA
ncbi:ABC transporter permease [Breznakiella homolactica]|uniref:ABC transporter permease n=1 Tax=Breznakiella homolactica TaxID=2798577 RepID=A0A7T7XQK4_9SPIR|nr:ABC transporter permease [Breznakiella homolactica]QQO10588.1 ABC transporter permease [Breznakiella homolactica]